MTTNLKASRCKKGLTYLKNRIAAKKKKKNAIDSQKTKRREQSIIPKENHQITKGKRE